MVHSSNIVSTFSSAAHIARNAETPAHVAIVFDADANAQYLEKQIADLQTFIDQPDGADHKLSVSLVRYDNGEPEYLGTYAKPSDAAALFKGIIDNKIVSSDPDAKVSLQDSMRQIGASLSELNAAVHGGQIPKLDGVILSAGNYVNPDDFNQENDMAVFQSLIADVQTLNTPIVAMADSETLSQENRTTLQEISKKSGVSGAVLDVCQPITFVNNFKASNVQGHHAGAVFVGDRLGTFEEARGAKRWAKAATGMGALASLLAAAGLVCCLHGKDFGSSPVVPDTPKDDGDLIDDGGRVEFNEVGKPVLFETGSAILTPTLQAQLVVLAAEINDKKDLITSIDISGHTSSLGQSNDNFSLSQDRADAVKAALIALGVDVPINAIGYGESQLKVDGDYAADGTLLSADAASSNRRVEFQVLTQ